jgi:hypothetical protein
VEGQHRREGVAPAWTGTTSSGGAEPNLVMMAIGGQRWLVGRCRHEGQDRVVGRRRSGSGSICPLLSQEGKRNLFSHSALLFHSLGQEEPIFFHP